MRANLLLALFATLLFGFAIEGGSRLLRPVSLPEPLIVTQGGEDRGWYQPDYLLFWKLRPGLERFGRPFTNRLGLRGPEVDEKPEGELRILSLGESSTFGWALPYEDSYSALLEARLRRRDDRPVRVVNAGVPAYTSFQGYTYLRHYGLALEPDVVLSYFGANDFTPVAFRVERSAPWAESPGLTDREISRRREGALVRASSFLLERSNLFRTLALRQGDGAQTQTGTESGRGRSRVPTDDREWLLVGFRDLCREHGIRFVIVIPWYRDFSMHAPLLREFASANDVAVVDLPLLLRDLPGPRERYFLDDFHPNRTGQRLIARAIEAALRAAASRP